MKSLILTILVCLLSFPVHAAEKESAYNRVLRTNSLRCAYTAVDPHVYKDLDTEKMTGPVAAIATEMAERLGLNIEWVAEVGHADFAEGLKTGRYDAYCGILTTAPTRARAAAFTRPYMFLPYYAFVRSDEQRFSTLESMNDSSVRAGVIDGEIFQIYTRKYLSKAQEISLPNMTPPGQLMVDLADGKVDVLIHDPLLFRQYDKNNPGKVRYAMDKAPLDIAPIGFAVEPNETKLRDMLDLSLLSMIVSGQIDNILKANAMDNIIVRRPQPLYREP